MCNTERALVRECIYICVDTWGLKKQTFFYISLYLTEGFRGLAEKKLNLKEDFQISRAFKPSEKEMRDVIF